MTLFKAGALSLAAVLGSVAAMATSAVAQTYPTQMVRMIVPFSAGSATDLLARTIADPLAQKWGQQVIVENRPGLAGTVAVAQSQPDGYTLMLTSNGHTIAGIVNQNLSFDTVKDFSGISEVASVPLVMIVPPSFPAKDLKEFVAYAKSKPGELNYSSPGPGSSTFIALALFNDAAGTKMQHVPYKGAPESVTAVIRNDAQLYFTPVSVAPDLIATNQVKALAVATPQRLAVLPNVPTIAESGMPEFKYDSWFGLMTRAGTPKPIIDKINADVVAIMAQPDIRERLEKQGVVAKTNTPAEFDAMIKSDTERLKAVFKDGGVK